MTTGMDMITSRAAAGAVVNIAFMIAGCAPLYEGRYDYNAGWREGRVTHVGRAETIDRSSTLDCRSMLPLERRASLNFARIVYSNSRHVLSAIVPVPDGMKLKTGDKVYLKRNDCSEPVVLNPDSKRGG